MHTKCTQLAHAKEPDTVVRFFHYFNAHFFTLFVSEADYFQILIKNRRIAMMKFTYPKLQKKGARMQNETIIQGRVITAFEYSHSVMGEPFYKSSVSVIRESHTEDKIPVVVPGSKIQKEIIKTGNRVYIKGQFRSYDCKQKESYNLRLFVFVNAIEEARSNKDENNALLDGYICKKPTFRKTPLGREISDVILAVPRQYGKTDYIPCVLWGKNALFASVLPVGEQLSVSGRIQSREYSKPGETQQRTAYEVSIARLI